MKKAFAIFMLFCASVAAQDAPRTIDFTLKLYGFDKKPIAVSAAPGAPAATLGDVAVNALEASLPADQNESGIDKFKRDHLAREIYEAKNVALTVEEVAEIKDRIGKLYAPGVVGAAWPLLDPAAGK